MTTPITHKISINPARLCQAIARIGYEPQIALMDIIDNAVTANATEIRVSLILAPGKSLKNRNSVKKYQVVDNGVGMDEAAIMKAFELGANGNYKPHSLSKYGMGLKSAGLSLGTRIHMISKINGSLSARHIFDAKLIEDMNEFVIQIDALLPSEIEFYEKLIPGSSGTIIEIDGCENINHQSSSSTIKKLEDEMGVVYEGFMSNKSNPLQIGLRATTDENIDADYKFIRPFDILFRETALPWDPVTYQYSKPYLVFDEDWIQDLDDGKSVPPIHVSSVIFPRDSLGKANSPLPIEEQLIVQQYKVSRDNAGCFIYRNGRLIRWGDSLGIFTKDEYNIRVRIDLTEEHDDILHVDVTKQRLEIDDELINRLRRILAIPREAAKVAMRLCSEKMKAPAGAEGIKFSELTLNVPEDDPETFSEGDPNEEVLVRQGKQSADAAVADSFSTSANDEVTTTLGSQVFAKIRYSPDVQYQHLWTPYRDAKQGVFVCINTYHPFYVEFMRDLADNSAERILLEALIFAAGVGQINTTMNLYEVELETITSVFDRFHVNSATFLSEFTAENIGMGLDD